MGSSGQWSLWAALASKRLDAMAMAIKQYKSQRGSLGVDLNRGAHWLPTSTLARLPMPSCLR